jgi:hypothetical protein
LFSVGLGATVRMVGVASRYSAAGQAAKAGRTISGAGGRKAFTAITAKMARLAHAVIKACADYRPFVEGPVPGGGTPLYRSRGGRLGDPVDNVRALHLSPHLVFRTVRALAERRCC